MNKVKKYIKPTITWIIFLLLYLLLLVLLNYFQVLKFTTITKINFIVVAIITLILGVTLGKRADKKGYLEGIKFGLIFIGILFILNLIFVRSFSLHMVVYYLIILASSTIGSMLGINLKRK